MGLFGRKKNDGDEAPAPAGKPVEGSATPDGGAPAFSPEKAGRFFDHARNMHTATNYEYAMTLWLNGLRHDPSSLDGLKGFFESAAQFLETKEGAKGPSKDTLNQFSGKGDVDRYLGYVLASGTKPAESSSWIKAAETAMKLGMRAPAVWLAERGFRVASQDKKQRKDSFVSLMEVFHSGERYDLAVRAGESAVRMDPADGKLAQRVKNISAESTMTKGGYNNTGQEGGFRSNIKDAAQQNRLQEEEKIVKTEETLDRLVVAAKADYEANPLDRAAIKKYFERLIERGRPEDEKAAWEVASKAYKATQEYFFKQRADAIQLKWARRKLEDLKQAAEALDADDAAKEKYESFKKNLEAAEIQELESRVAAYPSDLTLQFEVGKKYFETGRFEDSIAKFQRAKDDPKQRARVLNFLGLAFQAIGWHDEAIETLRQALDAHPNANDDTGLTLRYGLMRSLHSRAQDQSDLANAEEAYKIASSIAIQNISYKDIRAQREELKQIITKLKAGG